MIIFYFTCVQVFLWFSKPSFSIAKLSTKADFWAARGQGRPSPNKIRFHFSLKLSLSECFIDLTIRRFLPAAPTDAFPVLVKVTINLKSYISLLMLPHNYGVITWVLQPLPLIPSCMLEQGIRRLITILFCEKIRNKELLARYISTLDQCAYIFTTGLTSARFLLLRDKLMIIAPLMSLRGLLISTTIRIPKALAIMNFDTKTI